MADLPVLTGPSAAPASGGPARQLVILLHGVGADGDDLLALAPLLAQALPDAAFVAPDGPFPYDAAPYGRQWFSLADRTPSVMAEGLQRAAPILNAYIESQLAAYGLDDTALALVGFSQGTMMALYVAPRRMHACAAVVGFSGALIGADVLPHEIQSRPRCLLVHGDADDVVNPACLANAESALAAVGVPVLAEMREGLGHEIDGPAVTLAAAFLRQSFGFV